MTLSSEEIEIIGYVGGYVVAISSPFQLLKCLRTWKTRDVSLLWILNYLVSTGEHFLSRALAFSWPRVTTAPLGPVLPNN